MPWPSIHNNAEGAGATWMLSCLVAMSLWAEGRGGPSSEVADPAKAPPSITDSTIFPPLPRAVTCLLKGPTSSFEAKFKTGLRASLTPVGPGC